MAEDPANRRLNGGNPNRHLVHMIPMTVPQNRDNGERTPRSLTPATFLPEGAAYAPIQRGDPVISLSLRPKTMRYKRDLTDSQWALLDSLIPTPSRRKDGRGRPWKDRRAVLNGILWVLRTGAPWADLPDRYPPYQTCHRRLQQWVRSGILKGVFEALAVDLKVRGLLNVREAFIDGSFASAKKGALKSGRPSVVKEPKSWPWRTAMVCLLAFV